MLDFFAQLDILTIEFFEPFVEAGITRLVSFEERGLLSFDIDYLMADFV